MEAEKRNLLLYELLDECTKTNDLQISRHLRMLAVYWGNTGEILTSLASATTNAEISPRQAALVWLGRVDTVLKVLANEIGKQVVSTLEEGSTT